MLIFIILLGVIMYYVSPVIYELFGDTGITVMIWVAGIMFLIFVIVRDCIKMTQGGLGGRNISSGKGYSIDELEMFDMMDENDE